MSAARRPTWEERAEGYKEVQRYLIDQAVWAPIYVPMQIIAARKEVKNFKYHPGCCNTTMALILKWNKQRI